MTDAILVELQALRTAIEALQAEVRALRHPADADALQSLLGAVARRFGDRCWTVHDLCGIGLVDPAYTRSLGRALARDSRVQVVGNSRDGLVFMLRDRPANSPTC